MKKLKRSRMFGVFILIITIAIAGLVFLGFSLSNSKVDTKVRKTADDNETIEPCPETTGNNQALVDKYDIAADIDDASGLTVTVNPYDPDTNVLAALQAAVFNLIALNGAAPGSALQVAYGAPLTVDISTLSNYKLEGSDDLELTFLAQNIVVPRGDHTCIGTVTFFIDVDNAFGSSEEIRIADGDDDIDMEEEYPESNDMDSETDVLISGVDCSHINQGDEFQVNYCSLRQSTPGNVRVLPSSGKPDNITNREIINDEGKYVGDPLQLKCSNTHLSNKNTSSGDEYYSNINRYKATRILDKPLEGFAYVYNFAPGNQHQDTTKFGCKIKCTEEVMVKYGPPSAIKAGACFEYQVEATSTVNCKTVDIPDPPYKHPHISCTPRPRCVHHRKSGADVTKNRAGPDDDFDSCINSCDGGKYTLKCSEKCYKEIYSNTNQNMLNYSDYYTAKKIAIDRNTVAGCLEVTQHYRFSVNNYGYGGVGSGGHYGCYYWYGNTIQWSGATLYTPARFYSVHDVSWNYGNYGVYGDGFIRLIKNGHLCRAKCHYSKTSCTQILPNAGDNAAQLVAKIKANEYINPGMASRDNKENKETYKLALKKCKKHAICKVSKTTFTIQVNNKGNTVTNIDNNMSGISPQDELTYNETTGNNEGQTVANKLANSIFLKNYKGCYVNAGENNKKVSYHAKWGFLGACLEEKGALTNNVRECPDGDHYSDQYCTPMNIPKVNELWWQWYYTKVFDRNVTGVTDEQAASSIESEAFQKKCNCNWKKNDLSGFDPIYNIKAATRNFGYFGWNIDVNCFYAYGTTCDKPECTPNPTPRVRTVDLQNMFPSPTGTQKNITAVGRSPGFNWSKFATNTRKDTAYPSDPSEYILWVQKKGYNVYSDDYLDYEVKLTPDSIREIKNLTSADGFNFGAYRSVLESEVNSVINYKSSLLRGESGPLAGAVKFPDDAQLKCNNIGTNTVCENFK